MQSIKKIEGVGSRVLECLELKEIRNLVYCGKYLIGFGRLGKNW